jgi:hypothetical protein
MPHACDCAEGDLTGDSMDLKDKEIAEIDKIQPAVALIADQRLL